MKILVRLFVVCLFSLSAVLLASCAKEPVAPYTSTNESGTAMTDARDIEYESPQYADEMGPSEESLDSTGMMEMQEDGTTAMGEEQNSEEYKKTHGRSSVELLPIYFDFDQASIRSDQFVRLNQNGDYLKNNTSARVVIEGNCDERGTNEYNLALGERRALNAKTYLIEIGIDEYRIRTVSYGEERPLFEGQDEFSWSQNRRDDFILE